MLRNTDAIGRIGGEEFAVLFPETDSQEAFGVAERFRKKIADLDFGRLHSTLKISISIGIAQLDTNGDNLQALFQQADQALYRAKHQGRNQTVVSERQISVRGNG